jgi:hypothetical protein
MHSLSPGRMPPTLHLRNSFEPLDPMPPSETPADDTPRATPETGKCNCWPLVVARGRICSTVCSKLLPTPVWLRLRSYTLAVTTLQLHCL